MSLNEHPELRRGLLYNYGKNREFGWEIAKLGVNLVSLANNHAFDFGTAGFKDTLRILEQSGISYAGGALSPQDARRPSMQQFGRTRFSLLSYYSSRGAVSADDGPTIATINAPDVLIEGADGNAEAVPAALERDVRMMEDAVRNAKARSDIVMVHYHLQWVSHSRFYPIPDTVPQHQHPIIRRAVDAGADVIFCSGPHVLRGIEIYNGKLVFYSLGNFIYQYKTADIPPIIWTRDQQQDIQEEFQTVIPRMTVRDKRIVRVDLIPCQLEMEGPRIGCPKLASDKRGGEIIDLLQKLSESYGTRINKRNWYATIDI
jgi:poly-gamma-glutamate synthesis protein (capsule biosynthesis protein)